MIWIVKGPFDFYNTHRVETDPKVVERYLTQPYYKDWIVEGPYVEVSRAKRYAAEAREVAYEVGYEDAANDYETDAWWSASTPIA